MNKKTYKQLFDSASNQTKLEKQVKESFNNLFRDVYKELVLFNNDYERVAYKKKLKELYKLGQQATNKTFETFDEMESDMYIHFMKSYRKVNGDKIPPKLINQRWAEDGKTLAERIELHRNDTLARILVEMYNSTRTNVDIDRVRNNLEQVKNIGESRINNLSTTETTRVVNVAMNNKYKDEGYTHYKYVAILDDRTSEICRELNGQIFKLSEMQVGVNAPVMHQNCRSHIEPFKEE